MFIHSVKNSITAERLLYKYRYKCLVLTVNKTFCSLYGRYFFKVFNYYFVNTTWNEFKVFRLYTIILFVNYN